MISPMFRQRGQTTGSLDLRNWSRNTIPTSCTSTGGLGRLRSGRISLASLRFTTTAPWHTDTSVSNKSWGYIRDDTFKSPEFVIDQLVDIVSKNGNLLLNIGPRSDGTIPEEVQDVLLDVGAWLNVNGEAIYGTRPWRIYGEGPTTDAAGSFHDTETTHYTAEDFRLTTKGDVLYAIGLAWPTNGDAVIHSLAATAGSEPVQSVALLGSDAKISFDQRPDGLHVRLPAQGPAKYAYAVRITFHSNSK